MSFYFSYHGKALTNLVSNFKKHPDGIYSCKYPRELTVTYVKNGAYTLSSGEQFTSEKGLIVYLLQEPTFLIYNNIDWSFDLRIFYVFPMRTRAPIDLYDAAETLELSKPILFDKICYADATGRLTHIMDCMGMKPTGLRDTLEYDRGAHRTEYIGLHNNVMILDISHVYLDVIIKNNISPETMGPFKPGANKCYYSVNSTLHEASFKSSVAGVGFLPKLIENLAEHEDVIVDFIDIFNDKNFQFYNPIITGVIAYESLQILSRFDTYLTKKFQLPDDKQLKMVQQTILYSDSLVRIIKTLSLQDLQKLRTRFNFIRFQRYEYCYVGPNHTYICLKQDHINIKGLAASQVIDVSYLIEETYTIMKSLISGTLSVLQATDKCYERMTLESLRVPEKFLLKDGTVMTHSGKRSKFHGTIGTRHLDEFFAIVQFLFQLRTDLRGHGLSRTSRRSSSKSKRP